jgi:hypothetical protein
LQRLFSFGRSKGNPNNVHVRKEFRLSKKYSVFLLPHFGQASASKLQVAEGSISGASICSASDASDAGTRTFTPPKALEYNQFIPIVYSSAMKAGIPSDSSRDFTIFASYGVLYLPTVTRFSVIYASSNGIVGDPPF